MTNDITTTHPVSFKEWVDKSQKLDRIDREAAELVASLYSEEILRDAASPDGNMLEFVSILQIQFAGKLKTLPNWDMIGGVIFDWYLQ